MFPIYDSLISRNMRNWMAYLLKILNFQKMSVSLSPWPILDKKTKLSIKKIRSKRAIKKFNEKRLSNTVSRHELTAKRKRKLIFTPHDGQEEIRSVIFGNVINLF